MTDRDQLLVVLAALAELRTAAERTAADPTNRYQIRQLVICADHAKRIERQVMRTRPVEATP